MSKKISEENRIVPEKIEFRNRLIQQLKEAGISEAQNNEGENSSSLHTE